LVLDEDEGARVRDHGDREVAKGAKQNAKEHRGRNQGARVRVRI